MRTFVSLMLLLALLGCGSVKMSSPTEFEIGGKKLEFVYPVTWKKKSHTTDPTSDLALDKPMVTAVEFTPPGGGHLVVTNLGEGELLVRARALKQLGQDIKKLGLTQETKQRLLRELDLAGTTQKIGGTEVFDMNPLRKDLQAAWDALLAKQIDKSVAAVDQAVAKLEKAGTRTQVEDTETVPLMQAVKERGGKVTRTEEMQVDGNRAGWMEFEDGDNRGIYVVWMKDNFLYSVATNVPKAEWGAARTATQKLVKSLKVKT